MNLYFFDDNRIITFSLPIKKIGNFWLKDSKENNVVNIAAQNGIWLLSASKNTKIFDHNGNTENIELKSKTYYLVEKNNKKYLLFCDYLSDTTFNNYLVNDGQTIKIGKSTSCQICVPISNIMDEHLTITFEKDKWTVNIAENAICYINDKIPERKQVKCNNGDIINIFGVKILLVHGMLFINNPFNNISVRELEHIDIIVDDDITEEEIENVDLYSDDDYFLKSPRIMKNIETFDMNIDSPPEKEKVADTPLWVTLAPMLTMAASSTITLTNSIQEVVKGTRPFVEILPTLIITLSMLFTMIVWPFFTKKFSEKEKVKQEEKRQVLYQKYINEKDKELAQEYENQKRILEENIISTDICYDMITNKRRTLWSRRKDQRDFLNVRVGTGDVKFDTNISYHSEDFSMDSDNLKLMLERLINFNKMITNVPIGYSFTEHILTAVNGVYPNYINFLSNVILQTMAFHSYDDLKYVVFTTKDNKDRWEFLKETPYCFSTDKSIRFFATNTEEMQEVSNYLEQLLEARRVISKNESLNVNGMQDYYMIIIDNIDVARKIGIVKTLLKEKNNYGFSMIIVEEKLAKIPSEVSNFIVIGESTSTILDTNTNDQTKFKLEINDNYDMYKCAEIVSNLPIRVEETQKQLPSNVTFLELFGVGKIEQLNVLNRWKENNSTRSLKTEIGINSVGDPFILDLHEKAHGPHGLIAGMTGSGKSEFIITYVLSMAINYSPEEVAFVLIDYKGGGLAGAFVNSELNKKLPHVVGTITNLDTVEINRALASIKSELTRRQQIFNEVRSKTREGTIDIYKYQQLYRDGVIDEPIPHLLIVCDEFAELKDQQPAFMEDLVSTARIGRSLGVHLILATQKPSGVVDAQIWSNAKFKICLKVQDKQDSNEMIRNDLAAEIKNVGRFYLLVGYSEYFSIGQAAWAGAKYFPNNEFKKAVDKNLYMIDNIGSVDRTINNVISKRALVSEGEELTSIVKYLIDIGEEAKPKVRQLWLDRIPDVLYLDDLVDKYDYQVEPFRINPIIGEYDDPTRQYQGLLTLDLNNDGNTIVYGMNESGKDEFLQTIVYSMLKNYSLDELNLYLIDFGAETMLNFADAPQVGNVLINGDDEKINNLNRLLDSEMTRRKKLFNEYGGSYSEYIKNSGKTIPSIVVVINAVEVLSELYQNCIDSISSVIRDGNKYGIYFIITTESQSSVKIKVAQSCKNVIALQLNNPMSYKDLLGNCNGLVPSAVVGRGLAKKNRVCEFQTAYISKDKNVFEISKELISELKTKYNGKAPSIRTMPDTITKDIFMNNYTGLEMVPIGIVKENLNACYYDYKKNVTNIISSNEINNMGGYIKNIINLLSLKNTFTTTVIDAVNFFEEYNYKTSFFNKDFNKAIDSIYEVDQVFQNILTQNDMNYRKIANLPNNSIVVIGFSKFYDRLDDEHKTKFKEILSHNRDFAKINFILLDIPTGFKKYEYEDWFKQSMDTNNGLWIGPGLGQQFILKVAVQVASLSNINVEHAILLKNSNPSIIKIINEIK